MSEARAVTPTITEHGAEQVQRANATGSPRSSSSTGCGCCRAAGIAGRRYSRRPASRRSRPAGPTTPKPSKRPTRIPRVFAHKTVGQVADHYDEIIRGLNKKPAVIGHSFGGLFAQIIAGRGLAASSVAIDPAPFRGVLPRCHSRR